MSYYKLTNENGETRNDTQWGPGVTHSGTGKGDLCGPGYIHFYDDPLLAVFLNPIHANFRRPRLWECEPQGEVKDDNGLKFGARSLTTLREIPLPEVSLTQHVAFGILCAPEVFTDEDFRKWAHAWLDGSDRSPESARAAKAAAGSAAAAWAAGSAAGAAPKIDLKTVAKKAMQF